MKRKYEVILFDEKTEKSKYIDDINLSNIRIQSKELYGFLSKIHLKQYEQKHKNMTDTSFFSYYICGDEKEVQEFKIFLKAIEIEDLKQKYEYIYDEACKYLDSVFSSCNCCDFKNDQCVANREGKPYDSMGCCHSFEIKSFFGIPIYENEQICKHLINRSCETKNISCKLFTCKCLKKKGIVFDPKKILYLNYFCDAKQMDIIRFNFFKTKEEIIEKLLKKDHTPYLWWLFTRRYKIK